MIFPEKTAKKQGFTLIELLIVIAIIAILASLVLAAASSVQKKGARSRAETEIAALGAALESYKADNGDYPANTDSYNNPTNNTNLVTSLMPTNGKVYFEFKSKSLSNSSYLDPFGKVYGYYYANGSSNNGTNNYDLWSTAGGGNSNTWIKNW
jgi:type II secretion system protein G